MTGLAPETASGPAVGQRTVRRITFLIPAFGIAAGLVALLLRRADWAEGVIFGSLLAGLNFWWMKRAVAAFASPSKGENRGEKPKGQAAIFLAAAFRYALIGFALYGTFILLHVPLGSMILVFCSLAAAAIAASVWEILRPVD